MIDHHYPPPLRAGDKIAVLSAAAGLPGVLPLPFDLGLERLRAFGLEPVEYPTTRVMGASAADRARDVNAAFADPEIKGVLASIGGDDQLTVIPYLDAAVIAANPKRFFGYSDNTNLLDFLWRQGVVGFHGGSVMVEFGRPVGMHPVTEASLRAAMFAPGEYVLSESGSYGDVNRDWADPVTFTLEPDSEAAPPWEWHGPPRVVEGITWGGCLEIVEMLLAAGRVDDGAFGDGGVLLLETTEELPSADVVFRCVRNIGERGLLDRFDALLLARAKAWSFEAPNDVGVKRAYQSEQAEAVLRAVAPYRPDMLVVTGVDFGHTDPQVVLPYGGRVRVDGSARAITVTY
ncbi:S66 family peptidase [Phytomonospora endophytica]|uniref:Muramoyltetrapeptide carboxypeptidase LdcA involved in peptidoglycan recycling n=1 Tax=Phytomonospora endophytica TaxID=714109 RepID=A0A841FC13_9ACTN|nr:S66 peptidase family protein [Phytomonospora endophytica]MBB6033806.1 muramoyltetrapeptide carboxypeptidase LdcA involved in peptidoglycan recycling [Phytomonospora endophytica]GIG64676.1 LD-carboxypeptidase [Phytomonospora endophytica]